MAIDLGDQRTGLALGDRLTRIVSPLAVLEIPRSADAGRSLLDAVKRAVRDHAPSALVVGLPLHMDGRESPRSALARHFAAQLATATGLPVHLHDERLTSADADWQLARRGLTHGQKKAKRDALAAAALLNDYLAASTVRSPRNAGPIGPATDGPATDGAAPDGSSDDDATPPFRT